ncbi:MAG: right-handed parallel beta-helix repeat-containing protein, partial [Tepidisphaeraceae bacterium]
MIGRISRRPRASRRKASISKLKAACNAVVRYQSGETWELLESRLLLSQTTLYVDASSTAATPTGTSWQSAYPDLQSALSYAASQNPTADNTYAIEVAQGTYHPTPGTDTSATFTLQDDVSLMGGFAGLIGQADGVNPNTRDVSLYPTVLSGDLVAPQGGYVHSENVLTADNVDSSAVVDGFDVTGGAADNGDGGGMYIYDGSPTISNCTFENNSGQYGGAIYSEYQSNPTITNCTFTDNSATYVGGGIYTYFGSAVDISNCVFDNNTAGYGGGIYSSSSNCDISDCTFSGNTANYGGGLYAYDGVITASYDTFTGNSVQSFGGGVYADFSPEFFDGAASASGSTFSNCLFVNNSAEFGAGMYSEEFQSTLTNDTFSGNSATGYSSGGVVAEGDASPGADPSNTGGAIYDNYSRQTITNSIVYGDGNPEITSSTYNVSTIGVTYSDVQGGYAGAGNINADPKFADPAAGEYELTAGSPAIGAGSGGTDMGATPFNAANPVPPQADLIAENVVPSTLTTSFESTIGLTYTDQNIGAAAAGANWVDAVYLSTAPTLNATSIPLTFAPVDGESLSSGAGVNESLNVTIPAASGALQGGTYYIVVQTDVGNTVGESNLTNNFASSGAVTINIVPKTIFVDQNSPATAPDGASWATAFPDLQTALAEAEYGDTIEVAQGDYLPTAGDDENATFTLKNGVTLQGGFAGAEAAADKVTPGTYNYSAYVTTLSGDIAGDGHSYSVVTAVDSDSNTVIEGFTITGAAGPGRGGALNVSYSQLSIDNCTFAGDSSYSGGAIYFNDSSSSSVNNCTFTDDSAYYGGAIYSAESSISVNDSTFSSDSAAPLDDDGAGGAVYGTFNSDSSFFGCTFSDNVAENGGAIYNTDASPSLTNCYIYNNRATVGGGMFDRGSSPTLINCQFTGNGYNGAVDGGAIYDINYSSPSIINCTFSVNGAAASSGAPATVGGAIYDDTTSTPTIGNTILWNDNGGEISGPGVANVSYSDVQGSYEGDGNISLDPRFNNAFVADYSLTVSSPAIDAGSNALFNDFSSVTTDLAGNPRIVDVPGINDSGGVANVDMGAFEYQPAANFVPLKLPDLQPQNVAASTYSTYFGDTVTVSWQDTNTGTVPTSDAGWTDSIYLSTTNQVNQTSVLLATQQVTGALAAGASFSFNNLSLTLPQATKALDNGSYYIVVDTDSNGTIQEFSVQNNVQATTQSLFIAHTPQTLYVDASTPATMPDGLSWATAFNNLQSALNVALDGDTILVAQGTYVPTATDDPNASFQLLEDVTLLGGYGGQTAVLAGGDADTRNVSAYTTTLSGDIASQGVYANSYQIVTASNVDSSAVIDGFTITGDPDGQAMQVENASPTINDCTFTVNGAPNTNAGGALYLDNSSATISDCTFNQNAADEGGAIYIDSGSPTITDTQFIGNSSDDVGGAIYENFASATISGCTFTSNSANYDGGAIYSDGCTSSITNCTFTTNAVNTVAVADAGGALYNFYSSLNLTNCSFLGNTDTDGDGGAIYNYDSSPSLVNCLFSSNSAQEGGAIYNTEFSSPTLTNNTFSGNTASDTGGAVYDEYSSDPIIVNSILYGDGPDEIGIGTSTSPGTANVTYSDVQGSYSGTGNINADPLFVRNPNPATQDYGDLHLQAGSPAINAGNYAAVSGITTDLDGNPRSADGEVDMGAYEYSASTLALPDLEPQDVSIGTSSAAFGGSVTVTWTDTNIGSAAAAGPWTDDIFLSPTPTLGSGAVLLGSLATPPAGLAAGATENLVDTVNLPAINTTLSDGVYYILVKTDATNTVVESNGNNNVAASPAVSLTKTINWISATGGDWSNPANWSTDTVPGPGDDAVIDVPNIAVTISTNVNIDSLQCEANLTISGSLTITGGATTGVPAGSSTIPTSDLALWLEANQGVTTTTGNNVTAWDDQSGNGNNATPGSGADPILVNNAIGNQPALQFTGTQFLDLANQVLTSQQFTIFAVVSDTGSLGDENFREIFSDWSTSNEITSVFFGTDTNAAETTRDARFTDAIGGADQGQVGVGAVPSNQAFILSGLSGSEDASVGLNGATMYDLGSPLPTRDLTTPYAIGAQGQNPFENWQGDI